MSRKCRTINCADPAVYGDLYCWRCRDELEAMSDKRLNPEPKVTLSGVLTVLAIIALATILASHRVWSGL